MTTKPDWCPQEVWMEALVRVGTSDNVEMNATWISRAILKAKNDAYEEAVSVLSSYPPEGFNALLYERTERSSDHDPFWRFEGDTGNWAALMYEVLKPYSQAIRNLKHKTEV